MWWDTWGDSPDEYTHEFQLSIDEDLPSEAIITVFRLEKLEMISEIANNGIDVHHDVATQMFSFSPNGTIVDSFDGAYGWALSTGNSHSELGIPVYTLKTHGEVEGFVTVIELNGEVRGVIGISVDVDVLKAEKYGDFAIFLLILALVFSTAVMRRD